MDSIITATIYSISSLIVIALEKKFNPKEIFHSWNKAIVYLNLSKTVRSLVLL